MTLRSIIFSVATAIGILSSVKTMADETASYKVTTYTAKNGFPSNIINVIDTDNLGRVWLATDNGLVCNANYAVATYRSTESNINFLKNNNVLDIAIENDTIWMITSYGLEYFNTLTRTASQINDPRINYRGLHKVCIKDSKHLILGGNDQLLMVNKKDNSITDISTTSDGHRIPDVKDIIRDYNGNIWITAKDATLYLIECNSSRLTEFPEDDIKDGTPDILSDKAENPVVVSTWNNDLIVIDRAHPSSITRVRLNNKCSTINSCEVDDEGNIWIATENGVFKMSTDGDISDVLESTDLDSDWKRGRYLYVKYIEEGTVSLSCVGKGTLFLKRMRQEVKTYSPTEAGAINSTSNTIAQDWNGLLWIGTEGQPVSFFDKDSGRFVEGPLSIKKVTEISAVDNLCCIPEEKRMFMAARQSGVWEYQEGHPLKQYSATENNAVSRCLGIDKRKNIWVGTDRGIFLIVRDDERYKVLEPALFNKKIRYPKVRDFAFEDPAKVWITTNDQGVYSVEHEGKSFLNIRHYCIENKNLTCNNVNCIHINDDGMVFIGTHDSGLMAYNAEDDRFVSVGENNMIVESISSIVEDSSGILWITTSNGFLSYSPKSQGSKLKRYSSDYFNKNYSFIPNSAWSDGQTMVFGGYGGISVFQISDIRRKHVLPRPMIVGIAINNIFLADIPKKRIAEITDKFPPFTDRMVLRHNENKLRFNFANIYYDMSQNPKYSYMLNGVDKEWQYTDARRATANYPNLRPGKYTFFVRVQEPDNNWSDARTVDFTIIKPWWCRTWAIIIYLLVIFGILTLIIRNHNSRRHVRSLMKEVDKLVSDKNRIIKFFSIKDDTTTDMDKQMIDQIVTLIQTNLSNPDFDVSMLQDMMNMSASTLYRKVKALTGMSPSKFIQNVRLKQACSLLMAKTSNVSEVAYKVGFTDPKYFSSNFKKEFGITPSEYRNQSTKQSEEEESQR